LAEDPVGRVIGLPCMRLTGGRERRSFVLATAVYGALTVCAVVLAAVAGPETVQRLVPAERRLEHNDVAGFVYAVVG
jgi:hypothetical protein